MEQPPEEPAPGWYQDLTGKMRYWNGSAWRPAGPGPKMQADGSDRWQYPGYPYPAPAKKSSHLPLLFVMVGGFVLVLLFAAVSNTGGDKGQATATTTEQSTGTTTQQATQQPTQAALPERIPPVTVRVAPAGTVVRDGQFEFVVLGVFRTPAYYFEGSTQEIEGEEELNVMLDVVNIGYEQRTFYNGSQKLIDSQGREYRADPAAGSVAATLNPGLSAKRIVSFRVPVGMVPAAIEFHDSMFSGGVRVALDE
jgi:hypothetical protein